MVSQTPSLDTIFCTAIEIELAADRDAYVARSCGGDLELRAHVQKLLVAHFRAGRFLESPAYMFGLASDQANSEGPGTIIGPYKLLEQIGDGGMGAVFMAEQTQPVQRKVALKLIKAGMDTRRVLARFEAERQALAMMDHPNIAKVLDAGSTDAGRPYFVMELVKGQPITKYCDERRLTPRQRLELFLSVCQAIHHAHQKGIIHRDIKPSNILVAPYDGTPVIKVIDFGIAKATGQRLTEKTLFTEFGMVMGTLEYMSPEQAELNNQDIDTRSDVYSLGVLLYELLTGTTPLDRDRLKQAEFVEMLRLIREDEPPRPSTRLNDSIATLPAVSAQRGLEPVKLTKLVRGELDWIVMKALDKDRRRRYESANALAADVDCYLNNEVVEACPPSRWYRFRKFARRHTVALSGVALLSVIVAASMVGLTTGFVLVSEEKSQTDKQRAIAEEKTAKLQQQLYAADMRLAFVLWDRGEPEGTRRLLAQHQPEKEEEDLRGFEWHYLDQLTRLKPTESESFRDHDGDVYVALMSPDGKHLASGGKDGRVRIRDLAKGMSRVLGRHEDEVNFLTFSPKSETLVSASDDCTIRFWDVATGRPVDTLRTPKPVGTVGFSPDGQTLAGAGGDGIIRLWDVATRQLRGILGSHEGHVHYLEYAPDGKSLVSGGKDGRVYIWNLESREPCMRADDSSPVFCARFSPDGSMLATGSQGGIVNLWRVKDGAFLTRFGRFGNSVRCLDFSRDGTQLLQSSQDGMVRIWNVPSGILQSQFLAHPKRVWSAMFSSDGRGLVTSSADGTVKLWRLPNHQSQSCYVQPGAQVLAIAFAPDSRALAFSTTKGDIRLWKRDTTAVEIVSAGNDGEFPLAFLSDGRRLAFGTKAGSVRIFDIVTRQTAEVLPEREKPANRHDVDDWLTNQRPVTALAITPDDKRLAAIHTDGTYRGRDILGGPVNVDEQNGRIGSCAAVSPDGRTIAVAGPTLRFRDFASDTWTGPALVVAGWVGAVTFLPDGRSLALGCEDAIIRILDRDTNRVIGELVGHERPVTCVSVTPDGRTLASGSGDHTVRLWNLATKQEIVALPVSGHVSAVQYSPDGTLLAAGVRVPGLTGKLAVWSIAAK